MRLEICQTYAGCSPRTSVFTSLENTLFYAARSTIVAFDGHAAHGTIFLQGAANAISSGYGLLIAGDCNGIGYVIQDGSIISQASLNEPIQACAVLSSSSAIFCTFSTISIFDLSGKAIAQRTVDYLISSVACDGGMIYIGSTTGLLVIYSGPELIEVSRSEAHADNIRCISINPDGLVATGSQDSNLKVWQWCENKLKPRQILNGHSDWVNAIFWAGNGLYSASSDKTIRRWEVTKDFFQCSEIFCSTSEFLGIQVLGHRVYGQLRTGGIDILGGEEGNSYGCSGHLDEVTDIDWHLNMLLSCSADSTSRIFYKGKEAGRPQTHGYPLTTAKFLSGRRLRFISAGQETIMRIYEATGDFFMNCVEAEETCYEESSEEEEKADIDKYMEEFKAGEYVEACVLSELNLTNEILFNGTRSSLSEESLSSRVFKEVKKIYGHFFEIKNIAVTESLIFSCNRSQSKEFSGLFVWAVQGNENIKEKSEINVNERANMQDHLLGIQRIKATDKAVITASRDKTICVYAIVNGIPVLRKRIGDHERAVWDCGVSRDHQLFGSCSRDGRIILYFYESLEVAASRKFDSEPTAMDFHPFADCIAVGFSDGWLRIFDYSLAVLFEQRVSAEKIFVIKYNQSGRRIAVGGSDGILRVLIER